MSADIRPVEIRHDDESPTPGLELVDQRRTDGPEDGPQQARTVVAINAGNEHPVEDDVVEVDVAQDRVGEAAQPELVRGVLGPKLGGDVDA